MFNYTIIIPHYNIPPLLKRCIESIPIRDDIQIIIIDDCSPNSEDIRKIAESYSNKRHIEFYTTPRGGSAGRARNIGLKHALGKWLMFADADDFFDTNLTTLLDKYIIVDNVDVVYFDYRSVMSDDINVNSDRKGNNDYITNYKYNHDETYFRFEFHVPWAKIVKRSFVERNQIFFDETQYANDAMFAVKVGYYAAKIAVEEICGYVLTSRSDSLCGNFFQKPGEALIRTKVALRIRKQLIAFGIEPNNEYVTFLKILLWNKDFRGLREIYSNYEEYGITRKDILDIVKNTGKRYFPIVLWIALSTAFRK